MQRHHRLVANLSLGLGSGLLVGLLLGRTEGSDDEGLELLVLDRLGRLDLVARGQLTNQRTPAEDTHAEYQAGTGESSKGPAGRSAMVKKNWATTVPAAVWVTS